MPVGRVAIELLLDALATKRITRLVVEDAILEDARDIVWDRFPPEENKLGYLITCHACSSVWAGAAVASGLVPKFARNLLALSEITLLVQAVQDKLTD